MHKNTDVHNNAGVAHVHESSLDFCVYESIQLGVTHMRISALRTSIYFQSIYVPSTWGWGTGYDFLDIFFFAFLID